MGKENKYTLIFELVHTRKGYGVKKIAIFAAVWGTLLLFTSCSTVPAGTYRLSDNDQNNDCIIQNERLVRIFLENVINSYENYSMRAYARTGISYRWRRSRLFTHSFYVIISHNEENNRYYTLSFYGTRMAPFSRGVWAINTNADLSSYRLYLEGDNRWDVEEIYADKVIDVRETLANIVTMIDSGSGFFFMNHILSSAGRHNCNTALHGTIVFYRTMYP